MKDIAHRRGISLAKKVGLARLAYSQNGIRWCLAFGTYYLSSSVAERAFATMHSLRRRYGVPGLNSVELNHAIWKSWDWSAAGEEWTPSEEWKQSVIRRFIDRHIPAPASILEIGPGGGRWTEPLLRRATEYWGVDISPTCVEHCRQRFNGQAHARFVVGNGVDLGAVPTGSVEALFSFDVFVHINQAEVASYAAEFVRVLKPGGVGILHHGTVGGARGGSRSNLTQDAMMDILRSRGLSVIESVDEWRDEGALHNLHAYADRVTVFAKPLAA
jgi:SAM-dependent methyltransferase